MKLSEEKQNAIVNEVKSIMQIIDKIANEKKLVFDYGYLYNAKPPYWECEFINEKTGKTVEHYKAPTTKELIEKILA